MSNNTSASEEDVYEALEEGSLGEVFGELDSLVERYDREMELEVAEDTVADLARGITEYSRATFYVDEELEELKEEFPGSVFSELPEGHDAYELQYEGVTLRMKFGSEHEDSVSIGTSYESLDIAVPTKEAYFSKFYEEADSHLAEE